MDQILIFVWTPIPQTGKAVERLADFVRHASPGSR